MQYIYIMYCTHTYIYPYPHTFPIFSFADPPKQFKRLIQEDAFPFFIFVWSIPVNTTFFYSLSLFYRLNLQPDEADDFSSRTLKEKEKKKKKVLFNC